MTAVRPAHDLACALVSTSNRLHPLRPAVALSLAVVLFSACGGSGSSSSSSSSAPSSADSVATPVTQATIAAPVATTPVSTTPPTDPAPTTYTVVAGDSLSKIADRASTTIDELIAANGWTDGTDHLLLPGDVIQLPAAGASSSPSDGPSTSVATAADTAPVDSTPAGG